MLPFLNVFCFIVHTLWIAFVCTGWIWRRTRPWHLAATALTALSWFGLGFWYGWGYCLCADWHWRIRDRLGYPYDYSYTHLLILEITGIDLPPWLSDGLTGGTFAVTSLLSIALTVRDRRRRC
jgi:hypothetical protein